MTLTPTGRVNSQTASLVVEWDNVRFSDVRRGHEILARLAEQVRELAGAPGAPSVKEFLVLYNVAEIDGVSLRAGAEPLGQLGVPVQVVATEGLTYYQLKNEGARQTTGAIIVFADSDAVPEDGWLAQILAPFDDPAVAVVAGNSYVEPTGLYGKAFALGWYFPPRADDTGLTLTDKFLANNVAFRRTVFEAFPFPDDPDRFRSQCVTLAETLRANGVAIHLNPAARAAHPAPQGMANFARSALCNGYDTILRARMGEGGRAYTLRATYWDFRANLRRSFSNIVHHRQRVGLPLAGVPAAVAIASAYHALWCLAELATRLSPGLIRRLYRP